MPKNAPLSSLPLSGSPFANHQATRTEIGPEERALVKLRPPAPLPARSGRRRRRRLPACPPRPAPRGAGVPNHAPVLSERLGIGFGAELVQELSRALDIGNEPSTSVNRKVTVPEGRSLRIELRIFERECDRLVRGERAASLPGGLEGGITERFTQTPAQAFEVVADPAESASDLLA
jgi:hypothetical protein